MPKLQGAPAARPVGRAPRSRPAADKAPPSEKRPSTLIIGSEAQPFAKTGGLADVLGALPSALARLGWDTTLVLPKYRGVSSGARTDAFPVTVGGWTRSIGFFDAPLDDGARAILVDCPE